jgi:ketosteroid isomerase-like protein
MKKLIPSVLMILVLFSCSEKKPAANPQVLIDADIAFSDYSVKHGIQKSFIEFADDSVVILKDKQMPIVGKQSLIDSYAGKSDSGVVLTWKPAKAVIAGSGELGYTYGFWKFVAKGDTAQGTYMTVWKKDAQGNWKYIADTGNEGLSPDPKKN